MTEILSGVDLGAVFGIDLDVDPGAWMPEPVACTKCKGKRQFTCGYTRRPRECFYCDGTGVARSTVATLS